ncbi:Gfo/Idh/MocA family oxidoreductase [Patescibacteria group bacterium]|nr:MAG: Gfo/Idh/MocA family oxidoreductase [Patescibacteria group bacterium]
MEPLRIAIIGAGYWGKNLVRVALAAPEARLIAVCDRRPEALAAVQRGAPHVRVETDAAAVFDAPDVDAVLIATPVTTHAALCRAALAAGKHVWVEKPMTATVQEAEELVTLAASRGRVLHVDHTFLYTPAVRRLKELVTAGDLGVIRYLDSERINLGLIQPDVDVIADLAAHDLSIFQYLLGVMPERVSALGSAYVTRKTSSPRSEVAHLLLRYPNDIVAHVHASWLSPVKIRKMLVGGSRKMVAYDDIAPIEKVKVYDHGVDVDLTGETTFEPVYRSGDVVIPWLGNKEALVQELEEFVAAARGGAPTLTDAQFGLDVVRIIAAAQRSIAAGGAPESP